MRLHVTGSGGARRAVSPFVGTAGPWNCARKKGVEYDNGQKARTARTPTPNQSIFLRWRKLLSAPTAGQYMRLGTTKLCPRISVCRTVKSAGNKWTRRTARTFATTNSSRCQTVRVFERGRALTSTIGGRQLSPRSNPHEASTDIRRMLRTSWTQPLRLAQSFLHHRYQFAVAGT
jgi:hypothetical protein